VKGAMEAILLEADDTIVKPFEPKKIDRDRRRKVTDSQSCPRTPKERVAAILMRCTSGIVEEWLTRVKRTRRSIRFR